MLPLIGFIWLKDRKGTLLVQYYKEFLENKALFTRKLLKNLKKVKAVTTQIVTT